MVDADEAMRLACDVMDDHLVIHVEHGVDPWISGNPEALAAALASLESSGWVCIPREATPEMFYAWVRNTPGGSEYSGEPDFTSGWNAVIATAPRLIG